MSKKFLSGMIVVLMFAVLVGPVSQVVAQGTRSIVPYDRSVVVEIVDPMTRTPRNVFCTGVNSIDVKLTNSSGDRKYVSVINRDTEGKEQPLYYGWLEPGEHYLSELMRMQFSLPGPAGIEAVRVVVNEYGRMIPGSVVSFYVQDCGGYPPGGGGSGYYAQVQAYAYPYAIEQGKKGTVLLQTNVRSQQNAAYYFEILNSYGQLWKRIPVRKQPYARYQVTLPVGEKTKPGLLTYTVKLWFEPGSEGARRNIATSKFSFRVMAAGVRPSPYYPGYQGGYQGYQGWPSYSGAPYSGMPSYGTNPYSGMSPYGSNPYGMNSYGTGYPTDYMKERDIQ